MYDFDANDVFEMAEEMEQNGFRFYQSAAARVEAGPVKDMLLRLADMEQQHCKIFALMREELTQAEKSSTVFDPDGEAFLYLQALVKTKVFFEKQIDTSQLEAVILAAIQAEKDSIIFYTGMRNAVPEKRGRARIDDIIKEEMGHIQLLSTELLKLKQS